MSDQCILGISAFYHDSAACLRRDGEIVATAPEQHRVWGIGKLDVPRSDISAVTHIAYSARIQTVSPDTNPRYYELIKAFERRTGLPRHREHVVQSPRRADCLHAAGYVSHASCGRTSTSW